MTTNKNLVLKDVDGYLLPKYGFREQDIRDLRHFVFHPGDIFLISYPKCGSTWTKYIIWEILSDDPVPPSELDNSTKRIFPFLESTGIAEAEKIPCPRAMKLHAPYRITPTNPSAKYIYVIRNPFDCCVSMYHHIKDMENIFHAQELGFDEFFEYFMKGQVPFGDYFDHLLSWYEHKDDPNLLTVYYEDLKVDPRKWILTIAKFIGPEFEEKLVKDKNRLDKIVHYTSFEFMKKNMKVLVPATAEGFDSVQHKIKDGMKKSVPMKQMNFIRQGQTTAGKSLLSQKQTSRLSDLLHLKVQDLQLLKKLYSPLNAQ